MAVVITLLLLGYAFGRLAEERHLRDLAHREQALGDLILTSAKKPVSTDLRATESHLGNARLVTGSTVVSVDFFKRFMAGLRNIFGGRVRTYESLLERARREAVLRMIADAGQPAQIINLRIETSSVFHTDQQLGSVEVLAYGTALYAVPSQRLQ